MSGGQIVVSVARELAVAIRPSLAAGVTGVERSAMAKVVLDVSISLDGFTAGPNVRPEEPMGDGGELLHEWMAGTGPNGQVDLEARREVNANIGAIVIG